MEEEFKVPLTMEEKFKVAIRTPGAEALRLLLSEPGVDPAYNCNFPIRFSVFCNNLPAIELLLATPFVDPCEGSCLTVRMALAKKHTEAFNILMADVRCWSFFADK
jgi:hypothetical protein